MPEASRHCTARSPFPAERTKETLKRCGHATLWERAPPPAAAGPSRLHFCFSFRQEGSPPDTPFSQPDPRSTRREGPQRVASTPHLPEALLTLFPPDPSASRLHPVVQLPCFLLGGLPGTPQPAAPPPPPSSLCSSTAWRSRGHPERPGCQAGKPGAATGSHSLNGTVAGSKETCKAI